MPLIDYSLAKRATVVALRGGRLTRRDVCDAHPELMRAARHVGEPARAQCPVCAERLVHVLYVFGADLRQHSGRVWPRSGLRELHHSVEEFSCYVIEVCTACSWNHLVQRHILGRRHAG